MTAVHASGVIKEVANTSQSKRRIIVAFASVIGVLITVMLVNIYSLSKVARHLGDVVGTHNVQMRIMHEILDLARQRSLALQHMLLAEDPFMVDDQVLKMSAISHEYLELRQQMVALPSTKAELKLLAAQYSQTANTGRIQSNVIQLATNGEFAQAKKIFYEQAIPSQSKAMTLMNEFVALQDMHNQQELIHTTDEIDLQRNRMLILLAVGLSLSLLISSWVTRRIQHEIDRRNLVEQELEMRVEDRTQQLAQQARQDLITELPNRTAFNQELTSALELAGQHKKKIALFFMDLDGFKQVNDSYGHSVGDKTLLAIAQRLAKVTADRGQVFRVGGDEFTLIMQDVENDAQIKEIADDIIRAINQPLIIEGNQCHVGITIGCAFSTGDTNKADEILTYADDAMYAAKRAGKNRLRVV